MRIKSSIAAFIFVLSVVFSGLNSFADTIGYVNFPQIANKYKKAQEVTADLQQKDLELQQFLIEAEKNYKALDTPIKKKNYEDKVAADYKTKSETLKTYKTEKLKNLENTIFASIKSVATANKVDVVLDYDVVLSGGMDLTDKVIDNLNATK